MTRHSAPRLLTVLQFTNIYTARETAATRETTRAHRRQQDHARVRRERARRSTSSSFASFELRVG
jgi:hypothetical protein